jgi:4-amino-4-deoxy-L-arabinose transferase-like glycosyltransferase
VVKHHLTRYTDAVSTHGGPFWYYLPVLLVGFFPWSAFLPRALWAAGGVARRRSGRAPADRAVVACAVWAGTVFLFFSLAGTKLPSYLFPAFPALALLVGAQGGIQGETARGDREAGEPSSAPAPRWLDRLAPWLFGVLGAGLAVATLLLPVILEAARPAARGVLDGVAVPGGQMWGVAGLFSLGTAGALLVRPCWRPAVLAAMMGALVLAGVIWIAPTVYGIQQGALREYAEDARRTLGPDGALVAYGLNAPSVVFYANLPVTPLGASSPEDLEELRRLVASGRAVLVITRGGTASRLAGLSGLQPVKSRGGYALYGSVPVAPGPREGRTS